MTEKEQFDKVMDTILKADPKVVKQQMDEDMRQRAQARERKKEADGNR